MKGLQKFVAMILTFVLCFSLSVFNDVSQANAKINWKKLYTSYLKKSGEPSSNDAKYNSYYSIYLDNDSIPEILYEGDVARSLVLLYIKNGKVKSENLYGASFAYVKKGGYFYTEYSHMGETAGSLDKFNKGKFKNIHTYSFYTYVGEDTDEIQDCKFDDKSVSYDELKSKYNNVICKTLKKAKYIDVANDVRYIGRNVFISQYLNK